jgi:hypothetical protein
LSPRCCAVIIIDISARASLALPGWRGSCFIRLKGTTTPPFEGPQAQPGSFFF